MSALALLLAVILPAEYAVASPTPVNQVAYYRPAETLRVMTQREIRVRTVVGGSAKLQVETLRAAGE